MKRIIHPEDVLVDRAPENDFVEVPARDAIFKIAVFVFAIVSIVCLFQVFNLNVLNSHFYERRAFANMTLDFIKLAPRGIIRDRFGSPLVENRAVVNVFLDGDFFKNNKSEREFVLSRLSEVLEIPVVELLKMISSYDWERSRRLLLKSNLRHDQILKLSSLELPAVFLVEGLRREYRHPLKYSHLLGYIGAVNSFELAADPLLTPEDTIGRTGLEAFYDKYLRGVNGREIYFKNSLGESFEKIADEAPLVGQDLPTFIDGPFQEFFFERMEKELHRLSQEEPREGPVGGAGIAINPQNGEVLALVSFPSFDANRVAEFLNAPHQPLFNRPVSGLYNPGSTIKPLMALAALKEGVITPEHQIFSAGYIEISNPYNPAKPSRFLDWRPHGWVDVYSALARSSNIYFYQIGGGFPVGGKPISGGEVLSGLGIEKLKKWWQKFGLDKKTGIDLPGEASGFLPDPTWKEQKTGQPWRLGDTYNVSIGQGDIVITPLELLNYISAIANGGKLYQLRIVDFSSPKVIADLSDELSLVLPAVQRGMVDAVSKSYGTANLLADLPFKVAAKTGTAQIQNNEKINALFVGYMPADPPPAQPRLAILILIENAREGSLNTIPIAKDVFLWYYENRLKKASD